MYANDNRGRFPFKAVLQTPFDEDFIWWQTVPVPPTSTYAGRPVCDPSQSAIAKYMGNWNDENFRCPSDDVNQRSQNPTGGRYLYSYTMNSWLSGDNKSFPPVSGIRNSAEKILLVEEAPATINDGNWLPPLFDASGTYVSGTGSLDLLCTRHDRPSIQPDSPSNPLPNPDRKGNAAFVDGHAEYVTRQYAHYYGHVWPLASE